jgi:hypothetical protein
LKIITHEKKTEAATSVSISPLHQPAALIKLQTCINGVGFHAYSPAFRFTCAAPARQRPRVEGIARGFKLSARTSHHKLPFTEQRIIRYPPDLLTKTQTGNGIFDHQRSPAVHRQAIGALKRRTKKRTKTPTTFVTV